VDEIEIRFTEREVAQILWVLSEAADLAASADTLVQPQSSGSSPLTRALVHTAFA
jgi:hypothetical protein